MTTVYLIFGASAISMLTGIIFGRFTMRHEIEEDANRKARKQALREKQRRDRAIEYAKFASEVEGWY